MTFCRIFPVLCALAVLAAVPVSSQELSLGKLFAAEKSEAPGKKRHQAAKPKKLSVFGGPKRVEIDLTSQTLRAYEGNRVVLKTNISSGRNGATPTGNFKAGPYKAADHYSSLYHNAHMPWSVQIHGHIFIHGYSSVPDYPASHGCIRVPISGTNPAKRLYHWLDTGTPVRIHY
jgi:lipoprotein-anchoring transpeptidase ErfK/SrfK